LIWKVLMGMINELERVIDYCFEDKMKLVLALTHSFLCQCNAGMKNNQQMKGLNFWEIPF